MDRIYGKRRHIEEIRKLEEFEKEIREKKIRQVKRRGKNKKKERVKSRSRYI